MLKALEAFILTHFSKGLAIFILSMFPLVEMKGSIPFGLMLHMSTFEATAIAFLGSMLPVYPILRFLPWVFRKLLGFRLTEGLIVRIKLRAMNKSESIQKYGYLGLFLFVAIPIPGTGVWMGAIIASLLQLYRMRAFFSILLGNGVCACLIYILSKGILQLF